MKGRLVKAVEMFRILGVGLGFYLAYANLGEAESIRVLSLTFAIAMCGTLALEGLFLAKATAEEKGYAVVIGDARDPYQVQNTMWFLSASIIGIAWTRLRPEATEAYLLYVVMLCSFFALSAMNHAWQAIKHGNRTWQNLNRPFLSLSMVVGSLPIIMSTQ